MDLNDALKSSARSTDGRSKTSFRKVLVAAQIALAFVLVFGLGLLTKSFVRLMSVDPGFDANNIVTLETYVYSARYKDPQTELAYYKRAIDRLNRNQQIESTAMTGMLPLVDFDTTRLQIKEQPLRNAAEAC